VEHIGAAIADEGVVAGIAHQSFAGAGAGAGEGGCRGGAGEVGGGGGTEEGGPLVCGQGANVPEACFVGTVHTGVGDGGASGNSAAEGKTDDGASAWRLAAPAA